MSNETLLYIFGIALAVSAVSVSFIGLKVKSFPGKAMPLVVIWFAIFAGGSATFAVLHAKDEDADKAKEARFEEAGKKAEEEGGHVAPLESGEEESEAEGEGHSEEGAEEEGAEEGTESAEEGAEEAEKAEKPEEEKSEEGGGAMGAGGEAKEGGAKESGGKSKESGGKSKESGGKSKEGGSKEGGGAEASGGDPEAGAEVFATNCAACHGEDGHGGAGGPDLRTMPKAQEEATAIEQVTDGGGGMPPFGGTLSEEEIENVAAFVVQKVVGK